MTENIAVTTRIVPPGMRVGVTEEMIRDVVHSFYATIRTDPALGPIFKRVIGEDWDPHLAKMCDFWSAVMVTSGRYKGNPMLAHLRLKSVTPAHFEQWLALFRATAHELFAPDIARSFVGRAENIAKSLQFGMFFRADAKPAS